MNANSYLFGRGMGIGDKGVMFGSRVSVWQEGVGPDTLTPSDDVVLRPSRTITVH